MSRVRRRTNPLRGKSFACTEIAVCILNEIGVLLLNARSRGPRTVRSLFGGSGAATVTAGLFSAALDPLPRSLEPCRQHVPRPGSHRLPSMPSHDDNRQYQAGQEHSCRLAGRTRPLIRRNFFSDSIKPVAAHRSSTPPPRQRFTLRETFFTRPIRFSIAFVELRVLWMEPRTPSLTLPPVESCIKLAQDVEQIH